MLYNSHLNENETLGVNHIVNLAIVAGGEEIRSFKYLKLAQSTATHHKFKLTLSHDALGEPEDDELKLSQRLLGQRILFTLSYRNLENSPERDFYGTITHVKRSSRHREHADIILKGYSPTILMDGAPHLQSFGGSMPMSLNAIATSVLEQVFPNGGVRTSVDAQFENVAYSSQYRETHYNYLARLASAYGEQFYYDGTTIRFGRLPSPERPVQLIFGKNTEQMDIALSARHVSPSFYGYNSAQNQLLYTNLSNIPHVSSLGKAAHRISEKTFGTSAWDTAPIKARTTKDIDAAQDGAAGRASAGTFTIGGRTSVPFLYPGCVVDIYAHQPEDPKYITQLMVVKVEHSLDCLGNYTGTFQAIGAGTGYLPEAEFKTAEAQPQVATVIDNLDPDNLGRVQVQFEWQVQGECTEWIRVMAPDAGNSDKVSRNRGFVSIPEIGDQVIVGFLHCHPDRPYVMGSLFHGQNAAGGGPKNHIRSMTSPQGVTVVMNDTENMGSITISDPSGSFLKCEGNRNITIDAPETLTLNSRNMNINVAENLNVNVGMNKTETIGMNHSQSVGMMKSLSVGVDFITNVMGKMIDYITGNLESHTKEDRITNSEKGIQTSSNDVIEKHSQKETKLNSAEKSKLF